MAVTFNLFKKKNEEEEKQPLIPASGFGTQYANNLNKSTTQRYVNSLTSGSGLPNTLGLPKPSFRSSEDMFNLSNDLLNKSRTYQQQKEEQQEKERLEQERLEAEKKDYDSVMNKTIYNDKSNIITGIKPSDLEKLNI